MTVEGESSLGMSNTSIGHVQQPSCLKPAAFHFKVGLGQKIASNSHVYLNIATTSNP